VPRATKRGSVAGAAAGAANATSPSPAASSGAAVSAAAGSSVLSIFSADKDKTHKSRGERGHSYTEELISREGPLSVKQRLAQKKQSRRQQADADLKRLAAAVSRLPSPVPEPAPVVPVVALAGLSSSDDEDDDDEAEEGSDEDKREAGAPTTKAPRRMRHDTFLSPHHKRVLSSMSSVTGMTDLQLAAAAQRSPVLSGEDAEFDAWRRRKEHRKRLALLASDKLAPAPGVDAATLRQQLQQEAAWRKAQPFDAGALPAHSLLRAEQLGQAAAAAAAGANADPAESKQEMSPSYSSPPAARRSRLGHSQSLPSFLRPVSDARALVSLHPSSLSVALAQSRRTKEQLAAALPSVAAAFDSSEHAHARGKSDPQDQRLIDALTQPAHTLRFAEAKESNAAAPSARSPPRTDVAGQLSSMLLPFRRDSDALAGRGLPTIPSYEEPPGEDVVAVFQRKRVERSRVAIQQLHAAAATAHAAAVHSAAAATEEAMGLGRKDPRAIYRAGTDGATAQATLALRGAPPPAPAGKKVFQPAGPTHAVGPKLKQQPERGSMRRSREDTHTRSMPSLPPAAFASPPRPADAKARTSAAHALPVL